MLRPFYSGWRSKIVSFATVEPGLRGKLVNNNAVRYILKVNNCFIWFICFVFSMQRGVRKNS